MMNNLTSLIEYLNEDIDEVAISLSDALSKDLAAFILNSQIILYDTNKAQQLIQSNIIYNNKGVPNVTYNDLYDIIQFRDAVVGYIRVTQDSTCDIDTFEVVTSAAIKGYGPLLYDLMLSNIYPKFLISDRGSVSQQAQKIWNHYFYIRSDVNKVLLQSTFNTNMDDRCPLPHEILDKHPNILSLLTKIDNITRNFHSDEPIYAVTGINKMVDQLKLELADIPTAHKFQIQSPIPLQPLINNHDNFIKKIQHILNMNDIGAVIRDNLKDEANLFFQDLYHHA